jgi:hypothetical protein
MHMLVLDFVYVNHTNSRYIFESRLQTSFGTRKGYAYDDFDILPSASTYDHRDNTAIYTVERGHIYATTAACTS